MHYAYAMRAMMGAIAGKGARQTLSFCGRTAARHGVSPAPSQASITRLACAFISASSGAQRSTPGLSLLASSLLVGSRSRPSVFSSPPYYPPMAAMPAITSVSSISSDGQDISLEAEGDDEDDSDNVLGGRRKKKPRLKAIRRPPWSLQHLSTSPSAVYLRSRLTSPQPLVHTLPASLQTTISQTQPITGPHSRSQTAAGLYRPSQTKPCCTAVSWQYSTSPRSITASVRQFSTTPEIQARRPSTSHEPIMPAASNPSPGTSAGQLPKEEERLYLLTSHERHQSALTPSDSAFLWQRAEELAAASALPRTRIGRAGPTKAWMAMIGDMLQQHEMVRVDVDARYGFDAKFVMWLLESTQDCALVRRKGNMLTLFRDGSHPRPPASHADVDAATAERAAAYAMGPSTAAASFPSLPTLFKKERRLQGAPPSKVSGNVSGAEGQGRAGRDASSGRSGESVVEAAMRAVQVGATSNGRSQDSAAAGRASEVAAESMAVEKSKGDGQGQGRNEPPLRPMPPLPARLRMPSRFREGA